MGSAANQEHVLDYLDAIRRGDHARAFEAFAEDATWTTPPSLPWPGVFRGRKAIFEEYFAVLSVRVQAWEPSSRGSSA